ncbi:UNVERIFIED_CONTAM: putative ribonuclease H protein [Sesamum radiatum]|uniref:Ribonuclease H protein n=1 Tax=Sesamum radiatum TaxID=300843 RepID=A0AAW2P2S7_SESRA
MGLVFRQTVPRAPSIVRLSTPSPSWFKLNTNDSSLGNPGLAGAGGIIRDSNGHVHLAYQVALGTGTSVIAELTAVWQGLEFALAHGLAPLVVEVDAMAVIQLLQSRVSGKWEVQHLILRIVHVQQLLVLDIRHIFREANGVAYHLAKEAASLQLTRVLRHDDSRVYSAAFSALIDGVSLTFAGGDDGFTTRARSLWMRSCGRTRHGGHNTWGRWVYSLV